jgi:hypothetical protein
VPRQLSGGALAAALVATSCHGDEENCSLRGKAIAQQRCLFTHLDTSLRVVFFELSATMLTLVGGKLREFLGGGADPPSQPLPDYQLEAPLPDYELQKARARVVVLEEDLAAAKGARPDETPASAPHLRHQGVQDRRPRPLQGRELPGVAAPRRLRRTAGAERREAGGREPAEGEAESEPEGPEPAGSPGQFAESPAGIQPRRRPKASEEVNLKENYFVKTLTRSRTRRAAATCRA